MQQEMRRKNQRLNEQECLEILKNATSGVLALSGTDGIPYALPISFVHNESNLYFHCAQEGYKLECIRNHPLASFCVIGLDDLLPEKFTTRYQSVILSGKMEIVEDPAEKRFALEILAEKYAPNQPGRDEEIDGSIHRVLILALRIDSMSGKEAIELTRARMAER